jgi:hypothetical protein
MHDGLIHEEFISLTCAEFVNAESLTTYITEKLKKLEWTSKRLVWFVGFLTALQHKKAISTRKTI